MSPADLAPHELMQRVADYFEREGVPYRVVGSLASMVYGEPRFTNDVDVLVDLRADQAESIGREFAPPDFYVSVPAVLEAIRERRQFNIIHIPSGLKVDVIQRQDSEFGLADITHGRRLTSPGYYDAWFGSPENVVLMKLKYFQESGAEKHLRDIAGVLIVQGAGVDREYIAQWASRLGVVAEWQLIVERLRDREA